MAVRTARKTPPAAAPATPPTAATVQLSRRDRAATLALASCGTLLVLIAYTVPLTTLAGTAHTLHASPTAQTWALTGTLAGLSALLLAMGSAADDHGRKRVFAIGAAGLALSAALAAVAPSAGVFVLARVLQGAASAALLAPSLGLVGHAYPAGQARTKATGVWGAMVGLGITLGPLVGALVAGLAGWRAVYGVLAVLAAGLTLAAVGWLPESRAAERRGTDPVGVLTLGLGLASLVGGLAAGRTGWARPGALGPILVGVLLLGAFVLAESLVRRPMLDLGLLRRPAFLVASGGAFFAGVAIVGLMSTLPTVLQRLLGESPTVAAAVLALWSGVSVLAALQARRLATRLSGGVQLTAALALCAVGELALYGLRADSHWWQPAPGLVITGIGTGVLNAALARLAVVSVPADRAAMGSGANNTARYVGSALGVAVLATVTAHPTAPAADRAVLLAALCCLLGAAFAAALTLAARRRA